MAAPTVGSSLEYRPIDRHRGLLASLRHERFVADPVDERPSNALPIAERLTNVVLADLRVAARAGGKAGRLRSKERLVGVVLIIVRYGALSTR
jgi:hypothetical protein